MLLTADLPDVEGDRDDGGDGGADGGSGADGGDTGNQDFGKLYMYIFYLIN